MTERIEVEWFRYSGDEGIKEQIKVVSGVEYYIVTLFGNVRKPRRVIRVSDEMFKELTRMEKKRFQLCVHLSSFVPLILATIIALIILLVCNVLELTTPGRQSWNNDIVVAIMMVSFLGTGIFLGPRVFQRFFYDPHTAKENSLKTAALQRYASDLEIPLNEVDVPRHYGAKYVWLAEGRLVD